jgi:hypothetical protein
MAVFWVVAQCSLIEVYRISEVLAAIIALMMEAARTSGKLLSDYTALQPRRQPSSYILLIFIIIE